jgi:hypothetical protein
MVRRNFTFFLSPFLVAASFAGASPSAAHDVACIGAPVETAMSLPSPLSKWAQIGCTPYGQALGSRDGWVWASLNDAATVAIVAGTKDRPDDSPNLSFFTGIELQELQNDDLDAALAAFDRGLRFKNAAPKAYRAELTIATGDVATVVFFDFDTFAGGMWCPEGACSPDSRFLIMKQERKDQITAAVQPGGSGRKRLG